MLINNLLCSDSTNINNFDNILITSGILSSSIGGINTEIGSHLIISIVFVLDRVSKIYVINYFENTLDTELYLSNFLNTNIGISKF